MRSTRKSLCILLALCMVLCMVLGACVSRRNQANNSNNANNSVEPENTENNTNNVDPEDPNDPTVSFKMSELRQMAGKSLGTWEFLANMFPNNAVYRVEGEGYQIDPLIEGLPLNKYDWTKSLSALRGIDVSTYQGVINWTQVKASGKVDFAFIRIGYRGYGTGDLVQDTRFDYNARSADSVGIPIGVYFVTKAITVEEAKEEANWVIDRIKGRYNITWPVVMDFEPATTLEDRTWYLHPDQRSDIIRAFSETLKAAGYTPMIYANIGSYMKTMDLSTIGEYPKWFAQYFNLPHFPYEYQIWQATDSGSIPGITTKVDLDYAMYDFANNKDVFEEPSGGNTGN